MAKAWNVAKHLMIKTHHFILMVLCCGMSPPVIPPRVKYLVMVLLGATAATIFSTVSYDDATVLTHQNSTLSERRFAWHTHICFDMAVSLLTLSIVSLIMTKIHKQTASLHNRLWTCKCCVLIGIVVGSSYIPKDYWHIFNLISDYSSLVGGFLFIVLQLMIFNEFVFVYVKPWLHLEESAGLKIWCRNQFLSILLYALCLGITFYVHSLTRSYADRVIKAELERLNPKVDLIFLTVTIFVLAILSFSGGLYLWYFILRHITSTLVLASTVTLNLSFFTWSVTSNAFGMGLVGLTNGTSIEPTQSDEQQHQTPDQLTLYLQLVIQLAVLTFTLVYLSLRKGAKVQPRPIPPPNPEHEPVPLEVIAVINLDVELDVDGDSEDEQGNDVDFSWPAYYFTLSLASLYLSMVLTDFVTLTSPDETSLSWNSDAFVMKAISLPVCALSSFIFSTVWAYWFNPETAYFI